MEMAEAVWRHLNRWPQRPAQVALEELGKACPALCVRQLAATVVERRFVDGGYIGRWPFAVVVRVAADDTGGRLWACAAVEALRAWLDSAGLPDLGPGRMALGLEMVQLPARAAAYADGTEDWQAVFALQYKEERV